MITGTAPVVSIEVRMASTCMIGSPTRRTMVFTDAASAGHREGAHAPPTTSPSRRMKAIPRLMFTAAASVVHHDRAADHAHPARIGDAAGGRGREGDVVLSRTNVFGDGEAGDDDAACASGHFVAEDREGHGGALFYVQYDRLEPRVFHVHLDTLAGRRRRGWRCGDRRRRGWRCGDR